MKYEETYNHYKPDGGEKNYYKYVVTGIYKSGGYFFRGADNKYELENALYIANWNKVLIDSVAVQDRTGGLIWDSVNGFNEAVKHPKYMDLMDIMSVRRCWRVQLGA